MVHLPLLRPSSPPPVLIGVPHFSRIFFKWRFVSFRWKCFWILTITHQQQGSTPVWEEKSVGFCLTDLWQLTSLALIAAQRPFLLTFSDNFFIPFTHSHSIKVLLLKNYASEGHYVPAGEASVKPETLHEGVWGAEMSRDKKGCDNKKKKKKASVLSFYYLTGIHFFSTRIGVLTFMNSVWLQEVLDLIEKNVSQKSF